MRLTLALLLPLALSAPIYAQSDRVQHSPLLDAGFNQMYNLQFPQAHRTFDRFMAENPANPMGPVSDAAAYLFSEFDRIGALNVALFTDDAVYQDREKVAPNPAVKKAFDASLDQTDRLSAAILSRNPRDATALFAKTLADGLRADYASLIEREDLAAFKYTRSGSQFAHQLLEVDPHAYDAYLAVGMENYILGLKPAPIRWLFKLAGGETSKAIGITDLELTAAKGHYLMPLAKLFLAVAALRDKDKPKAQRLLSSLAREFPENSTYARQLAKISSPSSHSD